MSAQDNKPLILASGSAVRAALLRAAGVNFTQNPSGVDEAAIKAAHSGSPQELAAALAQAKAEAAAAEHKNCFILAADQLLVFGDKIYDKPHDLAEVRARLKILRGREHYLIGAMVLVELGAPPAKGAAAKAAKIIWQHSSEATLTMRDFSDAFLDEYLAACAKEGGSDILHSVGGYQYEGRGAQLFESVKGEYSGILGLALLPLLAALRDCGIVKQ